MALAAAKGAWGWYQQQLSRRPLRTQVLSSGLLWAAGDCMAQAVDFTVRRRKQRSLTLQDSTIIRNDPAHVHPDAGRAGSERNKQPQQLHRRDEDAEFRLDKRRALATGLFGFCFVGPIGHYWYQGLEYFVRNRLFLRPNSVPFIAVKVFCDTVLFGPIHLVAFFTWTGLVAGHSWDQVKQGVVRDFVPALVTEGAIWPAVQVANFRFIPVQHQLLFVNAVCLLDSSWLSWLKYEEDAPWKLWFNSLFQLQKQSKESPH